MEIAMKQTIKYMPGRRPKKCQICLQIISFLFIINFHIKINFLDCFVVELAIKKTLKLMFGRRPKKNQFSSTFFHFSSLLIYIYGDSYEADLNIYVWKTTSKNLNFLFQILSL